MSSSECAPQRSKSRREVREPNGQDLRRDRSSASVGGRHREKNPPERPEVKRENSVPDKQTSWTRKFTGFLQKKLSHPGYVVHLPQSPAITKLDVLKNIPQGDFIRRYLNGERRGEQPEVICSPQGTGLPGIQIGKLEPKIIAADTGPGPGVTAVGFHLKNLTADDNDLEFIDGCDSDEEIFVDAHSSLGRSEAASEDPTQNYPTPVAGIADWNQAASFACGISTTLYECNPVTQEHAGDPIADAYAVVARENCAILALGDGVNWGEKASLASKCAVHGCIDYLNHAFFAYETRSITTSDVFRGLLRSFYAAHDLILVEGGMLTTLTVAMVLPTANKDEYVVCSCNVGDSLAYVYSPQHGVRELTEGSHDVNAMRDMRDALGALGPVNGNTPELGNLTCAMTIVRKGDIVFITSDGVSDNFDPVVGKFAVARTTGKEKKPQDGERRKNTMTKHAHTDGEADSGLPVLDAIHRHELTLLRMDDILRHGLSSSDPGDRLDDGSPSAAMVCKNFIDFARGLTSARRRILEDPELYKSSNTEKAGETGDPDACRQEQRMRRKKVYEKLMQVPGKLDHASIVAYCVGYNPSSVPNSS